MQTIHSDVPEGWLPSKARTFGKGRRARAGLRIKRPGSAPGPGEPTSRTGKGLARSVRLAEAPGPSGVDVSAHWAPELEVAEGRQDRGLNSTAPWVSRSTS